MPDAVPPDETTSIPPLKSAVPDTTAEIDCPFADSTSVPRLSALAPLSTPPDETTSVPPLERMVPEAMPPEKTNSVALVPDTNDEIVVPPADVTVPLEVAPR